MRYRLLLSALLLSVFMHTNSTYAQTKPVSNISEPSFGIKVGASFNRFNQTSSAYEKVSSWQRGSMSSGNILWIMGGLTGEYPLSDQVAAAAEILYERKGAYLLEYGGEKVKQESIVLPISIKYYPKFVSEGISLQVGIQPSFAFSTKHYNLTGGEDTKVVEEEIKKEDLKEEDKVKTVDLALIGGIEYSFENGLKLGVTTTMGLFDRREKKEKDSKTHIKAAGTRVYMGYNLAKLF
ncbi:MAG: porin family protein [Candidatus Amoebophilus sp.]